MVRLHVKRGDESQFLFDTTVDESVDSLVHHLTSVYNRRLKVLRICAEMLDLADHGVVLPPNMQGLTTEQVVDLKLRDEWEETCVPSGGVVLRKDKIGRRNGRAPNDKMKQVIAKTVEEVKGLLSKKQVEANVCLTSSKVQEGLDLLRGAIMIVYPMGLPPHEPVRMEFEDREDLSGTQASLEVLEEEECELWWAAKHLQRGTKLQAWVGRNEKTKVVVKLQKKGQGAPGREPQVTSAEHKQMMMHMYRRQEELKKLHEADDDAYLDAEWSDGGALKRQFQGLSKIKWGPRWT